ncbi:MAG: hypothetical protein ACK4K6_18905, partial [Pseudarthrobacter sp.]
SIMATRLAPVSETTKPAPFPSQTLQEDNPAQGSDSLEAAAAGEGAGQGKAPAQAGGSVSATAAPVVPITGQPRLLVLDEPFEAVDPVSAANIRSILDSYVASGGTVIVSSHVMDLVQRMCDHVAVVANGRLLAAGTVDEVRAGASLEDRFVQLVGGRSHTEGLEWLRTF